MATLIDWSTLNSKVTAYEQLYACGTQSIALGYVVLEAVLALVPDDISDAITDGPNDRGIDAAFIDETPSRPVIHLFQFKYTPKFENSHNNFPGNEVDKLLAFIHDLLQKSPALQQSCNPLLWAKVQDIWETFEHAVPSFIIHLCGNMRGLPAMELKRLTDAVSQYRYFEIQEHTLDSIVSLLIHHARPVIDRELRAVDKQYFERSDGNIRGLVATIEAIELVKLITDPSNQDSIFESIFDDNVRVYLTSSNKINRRIIESAVAPTNAEFWYLNNGITITCDSLEYTPGSRAPLLRLKNVQIVNGGQTSHSLFEASKRNSERLQDVLLLVRIYETKQREISQKIAESTNSQTPIRSRDLRSNDDVQKKLEQEFLSTGYFYDRKLNQHGDQPNGTVIDALRAYPIRQAQPA